MTQFSEALDRHRLMLQLVHSTRKEARRLGINQSALLFLLSLSTEGPALLLDTLKELQAINAVLGSKRRSK